MGISKSLGLSNATKFGKSNYMAPEMEDNSLEAVCKVDCKAADCFSFAVS